VSENGKRTVTFLYPFWLQPAKEMQVNDSISRKQLKTDRPTSK
jgi:hypothetical protein